MALDHFVRHPVIPPLLAKAGGIKILVSMVSRGVKGALAPAFSILRQIVSSSSDLATQVHDAGLVQIVVKFLGQPDKLSETALANAVLAISCIAEVSPKLQEAVGSAKGVFDALVGLFEHPEYQTCVEVLRALTKSVGQIVANNTENQNLCIDAGGASPLIMVSRANKHRDLQTSAINVSFIVV